MHAGVAAGTDRNQPGRIVQTRSTVMDVETRRVFLLRNPAGAIAVENGFTVSVKA
jgi:hypothetical protein